MNREIEKYITKNYYELLKITKRITKNNDWSGDLLNEVILQLYEREEIKLKSLEDNDIKYYIVKCLSINWHSKTSPFHRKIRREAIMYTELNDVFNIVEDENIFDSHKLMDIMETEWTETNWFHKVIFEKYMVLGSLKKVAQDTTIPLTSIARYVKETKNTIKENTFKKFKNGD